MAITGNDLLSKYEEYKKKKSNTASAENASSEKITGEQLLERHKTYKRYLSLDTSGVDDNYLKTFVSEANSFISGVGENKLSYTDVNSKLSDLSSKYDTVSAWLYKNKANLDEKSYKDISSALGTLKSGFDSVRNYYSQWESDEDYNKYLMGWLDSEAVTDETTTAQRKTQYQSNADRVAEIDEELPFYAGSSWVPNFVENLFLSDEQEATRNELEARKAENKQYERTQKAIDDYYVPVTDEFLKNASYRDYKNATREELWNYNVSEQEGSLALNSGGYFDDEGNIRDSDGNIVQYANAPTVEDKLGLFLSTNEDERTEAYNELLATNGNYTNTWANLIQDGDINGWAYLTENEVNIYYDLYKREGQESAYRYLDAMTTELTRRATQETTDYINNAEGLEQVFLNAASIPMNVFGGAFAFVDDAANVLQGEDINPYSRAHSLQNAATDIRAKTAADIDELTGNVEIPLIDFSVGDTYQALMSGADSMLGVAIGGNAYGVLMGMGAASSTAKDLYTKGATTGQIVAGSLLAGAAEMVFEKYSIDKLVKGTDAKSIKDIIVNMLTQGGVEATEEMATEIANTITNYIVMGEQSDWVDLETFVKNVVNAGLGGFISGGGMSGIYSTAQKVVYDQQVKEYGQSIIAQGGIKDLQTTASKISENKDNKYSAKDSKTVSKLINKVAKNTSAKNVGRLAATVQNVTDTNDKVNMVSELVEKGLSKREAKKVADFVTELSHGYEPSSNEIAEIEKITDKLPDVVDTTAETATIRNSRTVETAQPTEEPAQVSTEATQETAQQNEIVAETESVPAIENATEAETESFEDAEESTVSLEEASKKYGGQAAAMVSTYTEGQDVAKYDAAYRAAYDMGSSGVNLSYAMNSELTSYLTENQRELAYSAGADASTTTAKEQDAANKAKANGNTGRRKGTVRGDGVTIADIKTAVNDKQGTAYKLLSTYAEATGIDIVLYKSSANANGEFEGAQGKFKWSENTIYIDINAGLANVNDVNELAKYTMLRTFAHEFTHFIEKWNPIQYNEFRKVVFDTLTERGENVDELITAKMAQNEGMTYDEASRETVAEAMTDILPDANFVEELATKHETIFNKLLEKLKEFVSELKTYFNSLLSNRSREANALKEQVGESVRYVESIVKLFDKVAVEAVENYQLTVAIEEATVSKTEQVEETVTEKTETVIEEETAAAEQSIEEVEKEYKKKYSQWLKRASKRYILRYNDIGFLSDGSFAMKATESVINYARLELPGTIYETALPDPTAQALNNANTQITNAPLEGTLGDKTVYVFNLDGKANAVFDKKYLSRLDGNLFYIGDFMTKFKLLKAVDANGDVVGFLLPMKAVSDVIDTKPSKLKSFSNKMQSQNTKQEVKPNVENVDNRGAVQQPVAKTNTASERLANKLLDGYINEKNINQGGKALTSKELYVLADEAFGGTQSEGAYNRKDAYDAMELAVNKFLLRYAAIQSRFTNFNGNTAQAVSSEKMLERLMEMLPTQNVRTQEMEDFQQFSTPPNIAYLAAWVANITGNDFVLEPSAGIGGLAVFAKAWGAEVAVNELSKRRLEVLRAIGFDHMFNENAEQIDNILPDSISPSVVIMNPPFSSTAGRTSNNKTSNAEKHIDQALARLRDGGRLVAILGKSMNDGDYYKYWDKLRKSVNIRANLSIDGSNYKKYGTTWGVQIVVIDKTGPQTGETLTGRFTDLTEVPKVLEGIRNDRSNVEENRSSSGNNGVRESVADGGNKQSDAGHKGVSKRDTRSLTDGQRKPNRKSVDRTQRTDDRTNGESVAEIGSPQAERQDGGTNRAIGRTDIGDSNGAIEPSISDRHQSELPLSRLNDTEQVSDDGVYATFIAPDIPIKGGKKHPAVLVESAAMAAVSMPKATYKVKLPEDVINNNLSDAQLVTVTYAGQAHEQKLPDGRRKGFFIGDGTGVGKGRQIAGIILDNFMQGRTKAVWISKNDDLYGDAVRDWTATTGRSKDEVVSQGKFKPNAPITLKSGVLFTSYGKLKMEKGGNRLEQIVEWVGEDFDGVIAFDEAHFMGNLFGKKGKFGKSKGSLTAKAGVELQRRLPNARIVYVSATAATEVDNLAYAERIGLWGQGTAFPNAQDFIAKIGSSGLAAMELVIRDMKAMGTYVARSISYNGVNYDTVEHSLDPMQTEIYNTMSRAWQETMSNVQSALETTGGKYNSTERQRALGNFYSGMQRFYNQVLTSMSMPSVIADMRRELDAGHSCVLQIVNTNEAQQNKQLAEAKANSESLDNLDLTPREALLGYLMNSFPIQMFEEYTDEDGNLRSRPVIDSAGNPVQSKEAIRQRDALVTEVNQMSIPDGPLEMLFDAFGADMVAENTGRSRRVVPRKKADGSISRVEERRTLNHRTADVQAFQDGKKRILVFSDAGGTGKSYHADRTEKNQQLRIHYVLQPGWVASNAVQGFGRTHRSNEASAPIYKLVTTNIKGQKRFTSTIARRLDQLGALTKGQRDTGSGMFGAKDNLETDLAKDSLREFYRRLGKDQIEGIDGMKILGRLGLKEKFTDEYGSFKLNDSLARDISTFLNRILALEVDEQNIVFDAFISIYEMELEAAVQSGTLDTGMENVKADKIEVVDDKVIRKDENTGSETHYIQAKTYTKPKVVTTVEEMSQKRSGFMGIYKTENGSTKAVFRIADKTTEWGDIQKQYRLIGPNLGTKTTVWNENSFIAKAKEIDKSEWQKEWDAEVAKVPEYNEDTLHMLTGALLPIWNSLPQEGNTKVKRLITHDGDAYLGRVIDKDLIDGVLNRFSIDRTKEVFTAQQVMDKAVGSGIRFYLTNNRTEIFRSKVSGEWRLEITQPYNSWYLTRTYPGLIQERIQYRDRYFIPVGDKGLPILEKILADNPVRNTVDDTVQEQSRAYLSYNKYSYEWFTNKPDMAVTTLDSQIPTSRADVINEAKKNAASVGNVNEDGSVSVYVNDIGADVILSKKGLAHGLDRRFKEIAPVTLQAGEIIHNSIKINELTPSKEEADASYVLIGVAQNSNGDRYIVRSVVNKFSSELTTMDVLYAISAKKSTAVLNAPLVSTPDYRTDISIAELLEYVNRYFPDILPESVLKHFGHKARPDGLLGNDTLYQQRTTTLTDREVLAMAADKLAESKLSEAERDALKIFQSRLSRLEGLQIDRTEAGRLYKEQQFTAPVDREAAEQTRNRMAVLDEQIKTAEADVLSVENKKVFGEVLKKARKVVETEQRAHDAELVKRWRDRTQNAAAIKKYRERIRADVSELTNWALKPNNKDIVKHIPDVLKNSVIPFLSSIDFTSKQQLRGGEATKADKEFVKRLNGLKSALKQNIDVNGLYSGYNDLPANFMEKLQTLIDAVQAITEKKSGEFVINQMTSEELKELSNVVRVIKAYITQINKFHANAMFQHVYEAGDSTIDSLSVMESDNGKSGTTSNFVFWQQIRPAFAFERFGSGGIAIYDGLRRGQAQLAFNTKKIVEFTEKAYTEAEVTAWEKEIKQINLGGDIVVKMPVSMIMSFYELSKQPDSLRHMLGEGFRVATYTNKGKKISDNGHTLTNENISTIINELTPRQKEVADSLQKFMAKQGGAWGNHVSVKRFGEELFTNEQYFPINSDGRHLQATADEQPSAASLYALLNMSFTKSRNELANNRIIVYSIFDVFSNHMASMAQYNAMALPVLDAIKWFNYQQKTEDHEGNKYVKDGVREQMARVYGVSEETRPGAGNKSYAESFVLNILKAFNGTEAQGVPTDSVGMNALRNYNMAQVAYNFRVVVQQPLAITRAALLVDYGSIVKGMKLKPSAIKQNIEEMQKYSGIAAWKSLGFYDVNISRGLTDIIKHNTDWKQNVAEFGMKGAEYADTLTWAGIWSACKEEVIKKQRLTPKSEGFYEAVTELFEEVIYKTQVVDSILTKNEYLRSKGLFARLTGSFMSEPTTTASMLIDAVDKYNTDIKRGMTRQQAWDKNKRMIGRVMYVYGVSAVILAAVQAVADSFRDDDDYETFIEKWLEAFGGNLVDELMPFNKLPLLSDFYDLAKELISLFGVDTYGNPPQSVFMQWYDSLVNGFEILYDKISGEDTNYTWYGGAYKLLQAASGMTGLPMASATREAITAWNNTVGAMAPSLKVRTYESGEQNEIKYAYADGYLTFEEAVNALVEQGLVDNEDEAYFTVQGREVGEGYSRYDALENAVRNGTGVDMAINELVSHGYTEDKVYSHIRSKAGEWYRSGEISKAQATNILEKYTDLDRDEITETVNKWSSVVVTGIEYDDIDEEFMAGNITASRAIEMYARYGSMTQEKATEKVAVLSFVKEHPASEGITYAAVKAYTQYCEPYGIEVETFYDVWQYNSSISADVDSDGKAISGTKKAKVLAYVNSLALSARGKDSLYYALGYAESTIDEAPWR